MSEKNEVSSNLDQFKRHVLKTTNIELIDKKIYIKICDDLSRKKFDSIFTLFLDEIDINVLYFQIFQLKMAEKYVTEFDIFTTISKISSNNVLLCVFMKNSTSLESNNFCNSFHTLQYQGMIDQSTDFTLLNSLKPLVDNFSFHSSKNRESKIEIMKYYSEFEFSLIQLQQSENIQSAKLVIHPLVEEYCNNHEDWLQFYYEFKETKITNSVLKEIYNSFYDWATGIRKILQHDVDLFEAESCMIEYALWKNKNAALADVFNAFKTPEFSISMKLLEESNYSSFNEKLMTLAGSDELVSVSRINTFLNTLFLTELNNANNINDLIYYSKTVLNALKLHNASTYPSDRLFGLSALIARDLNKSILRLFPKIDELSFDEFYDGTIYPTLSIHNEFLGFVNSLKNSSKRDALNLKHKISKFQKEYSCTLLRTVTRIKELQNMHESYQFSLEMFEVLKKWLMINPFKQFQISVHEIVNNMPDLKFEWINFLNSLDFLDFTKNGVYIWNSKSIEYKSRINKRDETYVEAMRLLLNDAMSDDERIDIFIHFTHIYTKFPMIQSIHSTQNALVDKIYKYMINEKENIIKDTNFSTNSLNKVFPLGELSFQLMTVKKMTEKYSQYMYYTSCILGPNYSMMDISKKIIIEARDWTCKNLSSVYLNILSERHNNLKKSRGYLYKTASNNLDSTNLLIVNYPEDLIKISYDELTVKALSLYNDIFLLPHININKYKCYKIIEESLRNFYIIKNKLVNTNEFNLLALYIDYAHVQIVSGLPYHWDSLLITQYSSKLSEIIVILHEKSDIIIDIAKNLRRLVSQLKIAEYKFNVFSDILNNIRRELTKIDNYQLYNTQYYMNLISKNVEEILLERLLSSVSEFLLLVRIPAIDREPGDSKPSLFNRELFLSGSLKFLNIDICMENDEITIIPSTNAVRIHLYAQLDNIFSVVLMQDHLLSNFISFIEIRQFKQHYKYLIDKIVEKPEIHAIYIGIEKIVTDISSFCNTWTHFQVLWDFNFNDLAQKFTTTEQWAEFYSSFNSFKLFRTPKSIRVYPFVMVRYKFVKMHLNAKYKEWTEKIFASISSLHNVQLLSLIEKIKKENSVVATVSLSTSSLVEIATLIGDLDNQKKKLSTLSSEIKTIMSVQKILESNKIPVDSLCSVVKEYEIFQSAHENFKFVLESQCNLLRDKISEESQGILDSARELLNSWYDQKPMGSNTSYQEAIKIVTEFSNKFTKHLLLITNISKAKQFTEMPASLDESYNLPSKLENAIDEISDIKYAWEFVGSIYKEIEEIGLNRFNLFNTDSLNALFHPIIENLKKSSSIKAFDCVIECQTKVDLLIKMSSSINELRGEIFKDRHWKTLFFRLNVNHNLSTLTISQFWGLDLIKNRSIFMEILNAAQGEHGLENYITSINDHWSRALFNFIPFKTKFEIINNWREIISKLGDHSSGLESMKASPYYQGFSAQVEQWQEKIIFLIELCETWSDVQRKWLYLFGIFHESSDIKKLLGPESIKYTVSTNEFTSIMKKVSKDPFVLNVFKIADMTGSFNKLLEHLTNIQKALTKYLEQERENFPRFYFVGDDDLLEILGNCNDVGNIQKHLKKMFPGIYGLILDENHSKIIGVTSKDDEKLVFKNPFDIASCKNIIECLKLVETTVCTTLAYLLKCSYVELTELSSNLINDDIYFNWIKKYPQQLIILSEKIVWCKEIERVLDCSEDNQEKLKLLKLCLLKIESRLDVLPRLIQKNDHPVVNNKMINLITNLIYFRNKTRVLINKKCVSSFNFEWLNTLRCYFSPDSFKKSPLESCIIRIADSCFLYAFEYLGLVDYIIQTPLIDNCFLVMTQALKMKLGGSPFGPAGTGKTESVKALGAHLGRFVIVFNCDKNFDFQAMGRIFIGLCRVGAWGCFDEFNRLEERIISAVSQQIHSIQAGLKSTACQSKTETLIEILGKKIPININVAIFITMNPGYAGRSRLPNNLTRLFRSFSMTQPDRRLIAQVILYSQGLSTAESLSSKVVPLLKLCNEQLSQQPHYDFGLRALKTILVSAGNIKRKTLTSNNVVKFEQELIVQSVIQSILPKLTAEDTVLFLSIIDDIFPDVSIKESESANLLIQIKTICDKMALQYVTESGDNSSWLNKLIYLNEIINVNHGIILVGDTCTGKTTCWKVLLQALEEMDGVHGHSYVIDPKAVSKEILYGTLDPNTRAWTDGVFTAIIRNVIENSENHHQRHWIVFDGDIDPEWVENLNSTLDDNKLFTLPNGERLCLPPNIRILFEVSDLKYATPATISRCGMIHFSESTVSIDMAMNHYFETLKLYNLNSEAKDNPFNDVFNIHKLENCQINEDQTKIVTQIKRILTSDKLIHKLVTYCQNHVQHCMDFNFIRSLQSMFIILAKSIREIYDSRYILKENNLEIIHNLVLYSLVWGFSGDCSHLDRLEFCQYLCETSININHQPSQILVQNYFTFEKGFVEWAQLVSTLDTMFIPKSNLLVPTQETARNSLILSDIILENRLIILCGPPGCGKSMLIHNIKVLLPSWDILTINFSSTTTSDDLLRYILQGCEYRKGAHSQILCPKNGKNLIIFCDDLNLSHKDDYGTQSAICLLRQLLELKGFYRKDRFWVKLDKIKFVASCSPPTYVGRKPLMGKFLRHAFILYIDYPSNECLFKIFTTLNTFPQLKTDQSLPGKITHVMIEFYNFVKEIFTLDTCAHYVFTPRDLTQWVQGIYELTRNKVKISIQDLVEALFYEGLAVFSDRLIKSEERELVLCKLLEIINHHFSNNSLNVSSTSRIFTDWITNDFILTELGELVKFSQAKILNINDDSIPSNCLFDQFLQISQYVSRIVHRQQGHLMLVGKNGSGRKSIVEFVASMLDIFIFKARWHSSYSLSDFDQEIRNVLKRIVTKNQQVFFIVDEASHLPPLFFERVNVLVSNGDLSDLYQGEKYTSLLSMLREASSRNKISFGDTDELYQWFIDLIKSNLHFIFLFNNNLTEWSGKVGSHPCLFKNCVIKWCGDLSVSSFCQIAIQLTLNINLSFAEYNIESLNYICTEALSEPSLIHSVVHSLVSIHLCFSNILKLSYKNTPSAQRYMLFINQFKNILNEKLNNIEEEHSHISTGLLKLEQTFSEVAIMKEELSSNQKELEIKNIRASQKLSEMASEQQKAQITREEAMKLFEQVKIQSEQIIVKSRDIKVELSQVEPAMEEAKEALSIIDRGKLNEIKVMYNPNQLIRLAISSVFELITGGCSENWKTVKSFLNRDDFINTIRNYKTESITPERRLIMNKFLENEKYTPEMIARGSTACSPLVNWVRAHLSYFDILMKIDPLKLELSNLEVERETKEKQANELQSKINELESKIEEFKLEYSVLIREIEEVKQILCQTERKLSISSSILTNLELEQKRWAASHHTFQQKKNILVGNCILSAAFIVYFGNFDKGTRDLLWSTWIDILNSVNISFDENLLRVEYLTTPDERMHWGNLGLPNEYLCLENATILKYSNSFSFIIDPSGQAFQFLNNFYMDRKAITTSFLNSNFRKELESSTRFGNILIIKNAEFYDPSINSLIEYNSKSNNNRKTVNIGGTKIDVSPSFKMFLITSDPTYSLPVNVGSRMCITNFTVTFSGLESQCLYKTFQNERPDLEEKRIELTKMQGEYNLRLYNLQKKLLSVLNEAQGGLLDDDRIVSTLKQLNEQSIEISSKVEDSKNHLVVVNSSLDFYQPFATTCSSLYFLLQHLHAINNLYHYSLKFFFDIFNSVFIDVPPSSTNDDTIHLDNLVIILFQKLVERVIYGLLQKDKQLFLIVLSRIYLKYLPNSQILIDSIDFLIKNQSITITEEKFINFPTFSPECNTSLNKIFTLKQFSASAMKIDSLSTELTDWAKCSKINSPCPKVWSDIPDVNYHHLESLSSLLLCFVLSPNDSFFFFEKFLNTIFGDQLFKLYHSQLDLKKVILNEISFETPILLLSVSGYDPTSWIDDIVANEPGIQLKVVAMGSSESCLEAENELNECSKSGKWLVLKNIHLASHWIKDLEKKLADLKANPTFRLLLTAEILSNLPASLLRSSRFITFEPPPGIKSGMLRTFNIISKSRFQKKPKERSKVYFLLAWLHTVIVERLDYLNLGWTKAYDFSESDLRVAFDMVDSWIDQVSGDRSNLPPEKMPWEAMTSLICLSIYGSYIENVFDNKILDSLVDDIFSPKSFSNAKILVAKSFDQQNDICVPDYNEHVDYVSWIESLPNQQNTSWLKLPKSAEYILQTSKLHQMLSNFLKISEANSKSISQSIEDFAETNSQKLIICSRFAEYWLKQLPSSLDFDQFQCDSALEPISRFYQREFFFGKNLLNIVRNDLNQIIAYKKASIKMNNHLNDLIFNIYVSRIPNHWIKFNIPSNLTLNSWIQDLSSRLHHLDELIHISRKSLQSLIDVPVMLGKFFFPEAFTTAIRQLSSRKLNVALEQLKLKVTIIDSSGSNPPHSTSNLTFLIFGLKIIGSCLNNQILEFSENIHSELPHIQLEWVSDDQLSSNQQDVKLASLPVYLDNSRRNVLFNIDFFISKTSESSNFFLQGVAVYANMYSN